MAPLRPRRFPAPFCQGQPQGHEDVRHDEERGDEGGRGDHCKRQGVCEEREEPPGGESRVEQRGEEACGEQGQKELGGGEGLHGGANKG